MTIKKQNKTKQKPSELQEGKIIKSPLSYVEVLF
jgi:hypothetical protein